jgi:hypothetical protein
VTIDAKDGTGRYGGGAVIVDKFTRGGGTLRYAPERSYRHAAFLRNSMGKSLPGQAVLAPGTCPWTMTWEGEIS